MKEEAKKIYSIVTDEEMVEMGMRPKNLEPRDQSLWSKTSKEREAWHKVRNVPAPEVSSRKVSSYDPFTVKLIVHTIGMEKTTFSHICKKSQVPFILNKYKTLNSSVTNSYII